MNILSSPVDANIKQVNDVAVTGIGDFNSVAPGLTEEQEIALNAIKAKTDKLTFDLTNHLLSYIEDKNGYALTVDERIAIADEVASRGSSLTLEDIATSVRNKVVGDIYASVLIS